MSKSVDSERSRLSTRPRARQDEIVGDGIPPESWTNPGEGRLLTDYDPSTGHTRYLDMNAPHGTKLVRPRGSAVAFSRDAILQAAKTGEHPDQKPPQNIDDASVESVGRGGGGGFDDDDSYPDLPGVVETESIALASTGPMAAAVDSGDPDDDSYHVPANEGFGEVSIAVQRGVITTEDADRNVTYGSRSEWAQHDDVEEMKDEEGNVYFVDPRTGQSAWTFQELMAARAQVEAEATRNRRRRQQTLLIEGGRDTAEAYLSIEGGGGGGSGEDLSFPSSCSDILEGGQPSLFHSSIGSGAGGGGCGRTAQQSGDQRQQQQSGDQRQLQQRQQQQSGDQRQLQQWEQEPKDKKKKKNKQVMLVPELRFDWCTTQGGLNDASERHAKAVTCVACCVTQDAGPRMVTGSYDKTVRIWDGATGKHLVRLEGHRGLVTAVAICSTKSVGGGLRVASASGSDSDRRVRVFKGLGAQQTSHSGDASELPRRTDGGAETISRKESNGTSISSPTGRGGSGLGGGGRAATAKPELLSQYVINGGLQDGAELPQELYDHGGGGYVAPAVLGSSGDDSSSEPFAGGGEEFGHQGAVTCVAFAELHDKSLVVVSGGCDQVLRVWNESSGDLWAVLAGHTGAVRAVACLVTQAVRGVGRHDGTNGGQLRIASGSNDKAVLLWDGDEGGPPLKSFQGHEDKVCAVSVHETGWAPGALLVVSASYDRSIRIWDGSVEGDASCLLKLHTGARLPCVSAMACALIASHDLADSVAAKQKHELESNAAGTAGGGSVGVPVARARVQKDPRALRVRIVAGFRGNTLKAWDCGATPSTGFEADQASVPTFEVEMKESVSDVAITPGGDRVFAGLKDGSVHAFRCHRTLVKNAKEDPEHARREERESAIASLAQLAPKRRTEAGTAGRGAGRGRAVGGGGGGGQRSDSGKGKGERSSGMGAHNSRPGRLAGKGARNNSPHVGSSVSKGGEGGGGGSGGGGDSGTNTVGRFRQRQAEEARREFLAAAATGGAGKGGHGDGKGHGEGKGKEGGCVAFSGGEGERRGSSYSHATRPQADRGKEAPPFPRISPNL